MGKAGLVSARGLRGMRKYAVVGILILAALVTPPDVVSQMILFTVVYGLYEISIHACRAASSASARPNCAPKACWAKARASMATRPGIRTAPGIPRRERAGSEPDRRGAGTAGPGTASGSGFHRRLRLCLACGSRSPDADRSGQPGRCRPAGRASTASRDTLLANTRQFAAGLPANNVLLWGARGMGKSSLSRRSTAAVHDRAARSEDRRDPARGPVVDRALPDTAARGRRPLHPVLRRPVLRP